MLVYILLFSIIRQEGIVAVPARKVSDLPTAAIVLVDVCSNKKIRKKIT
jgi:hypothetical protein